MTNKQKKSLIFETPNYNELISELKTVSVPRKETMGV